MKVPTRFVEPLTEEEMQTLQTHWKESDNHRQRTRSQAILLSDRGYSIDQIAEITLVQRNTVCHWLDAWEQDRTEGLQDAPRPGAPRRFDSREETRILELLEQYPNQPKTVCALIEQETGKTLTDDILSRIAHEHQYT